MFIVFDCTKAQGTACTVPFAWLAKRLAFALTHMTGRVYDWDASK